MPAHVGENVWTRLLGSGLRSSAVQQVTLNYWGWHDSRGGPHWAGFRGCACCGCGRWWGVLLSSGRVHVLCMDSNGWIKVKCRRINDFRIASYHGTGLTILIFGEKKSQLIWSGAFLFALGLLLLLLFLLQASYPYHLPNSVSAFQPRLHNKPSRRLLEYAHKPLNFNYI